MGESKSIRVAFYIRVSTDEQAKDWFGLGMQESGLKDMMGYRSKHHDWIHNESWLYIDDGYTGADLNRPNFKRMMEDAKHGKFDMVAVWKIDRLSRNLSHLLTAFETLQSYSVWFFSLKENIDFSWPIWKLTFQIFGALAEFERETIKVRTREGKNESARRGNYVINAAPFGYKKVQNVGKIWKWLEIVQEEANWVKRVFSEFNAWKSLESIAKILNENYVSKGMGSIRKAKDTKWHGTTVSDILKNTTYIGSAIFNPTNDKGEVEPIEIPVPKILHALDFEIASARLENLSKEAERGGGKNQYLLSRKIVDTETGRHFVGVTRSKWGHNYRRKAIEGHPNRDIPWASVDEYVWSHIEKAMHRPEALFEAYRKQSLDDSNYNSLRDRRIKADTRLTKLQDEEYTIQQAYVSGKYDDTMHEKLINNNGGTQRAIKAEIANLDKELDAIIKAESTKKLLESFSENLNMSIENLTFEQKKNLIDILVEKIEVTYNKTQQVVKVTMRFAHDSTKEESTGYEPKTPTTKPKGGSDGGVDDNYGATSWT